MRIIFFKRFLLAAGILFLCSVYLPGMGIKKALRQCGIEYLDSSFAMYDRIQKQLHGFAEPGYQENRSSALLAAFLEENGFSVERGVAGIPTAFVATYGSGHPVIGVMAEYDALPGLSQDPVAYRKPIEGQPYGHGCGHNLIGSAAVASGVSISRFLEKSGVQGTIKVYGCPAEEGGGGNVSQVTPVARLRVATTTTGIHTWQQTAIGGTTIGTKSILNVAKVFYLTAVDLYTDPAKVKAVRDEFESIQGPAPVFVPLMGDRKPPLDYRK